MKKSQDYKPIKAQNNVLEIVKKYKKRIININSETKI